MGMPNIPNITPNINISREAVINLLLASIGLEELGLAHIINAEGQKLQAIVEDSHSDKEDLIEIDKSVERILKDVIKKEMLLEFKFENILELCEKCDKGKKDC